MKTFILMLPIALLALASCSSKPAVKAPAAQQPANASAYTDVDPVCGMVRDSSWTDYTLFKGDTMWFCAAPEMRAFIANPDKYMAAKPADSIQNHHQ